MRLLLMSNSRNAGMGFFEHARREIDQFLGAAERIVFVPWAAVRFSLDEYAALVASALPGRQVTSVHATPEPLRALERAEVVVVGGGNTFQLVARLHASGLMDAIREAVQGGVPFMGWSAGSNVANPTLRTTNDMPIVEPASFRTLGLIPFQTNPHFMDIHPAGHSGETREDRLLEFVAVNKDIPVVGLREGSMLQRAGSQLELLGTAGARLYRSGYPPRELAVGDRLDDLLTPGPH